jgi:hypothetical protein
MKKGLIVSLVCVNAGLLAALVIGNAMPRAEAQVIGAEADYLMMTGQYSSNKDALWVLELGTRRLMAFQFDRTKQRMLPLRGRELNDDFPVRRAVP